MIEKTFLGNWECLFLTVIYGCDKIKMAESTQKRYVGGCYEKI